eukprot:713200-Alexandrium_andersonii.AAC.1
MDTHAKKRRGRNVVYTVAQIVLYRAHAGNSQQLARKVHAGACCFLSQYTISAPWTWASKAQGKLRERTLVKDM